MSTTDRETTCSRAACSWISPPWGFHVFDVHGKPDARCRAARSGRRRTLLRPATHPLAACRAHASGNRRKKQEGPMNDPTRLSRLEMRLSRKLLDVLIRAGLVFAMVVLCYRIFSPFISLMAWAVILAVTLYPAHQKLARKLGGKQGLAATLLVLGGHRADRGAHGGADGLAGRFRSWLGRQRARQHLADSRALARRRRVAGRRREGLWSLVAGPHGSAGRHSEPAAQSSAIWPGRRWGWLPASAARCLLFLFSFIVAGIIMAFGQSGAASTRSIFGRIMGPGAARDLQRCPRRPFVRWHRASWGWPSSRPSSSAWYW